MSHKDFLVELGTEELPPKALLKLSKAFAAGIESGFRESNLRFEEIQIFSTPRRLAVKVAGLSTVQPDSTIEKVGPAVKAAFDEQGNPTKAAIGFAKSCGVDVSSLSTTSKDGVEKLFYSIRKEGAKTENLLPDFVKKSLDRLPIPKRMRWGSSRTEFVRPVHWCVMLFGEEIVDTEILAVRTGRLSYGHRFHHPAAIVIDSPDNYESLLQDEGFIIPGFEARREIIRNQVLTIAKDQNATAVIDHELLDEVTALVEFPVPLSGKFDQEFLQVPPEALILAMKSHQKYFHLVDADGSLMPSFISVSNIRSTDPEQVVAGNEKVIRPRLADARFFYETDLKATLESRVESLKNVVFQDRLGTVFDKSQRVARLSVHISEKLGGNGERCQRAAILAKCDLLTNMVGEFADLQGLMGYYYATADGEDPEVASAIVEQYLPRFSGDKLPETLTGSIVSLSEKLDTIVGLFAIDQPPTGSKDPFAIRRSALGILRILVDNKLDLDLLDSIEFALTGYADLPVEESIANTVFDFMLERFKAWYQDRDIPAETFQAVKALRPTRPFDFDKRVEAVHRFTSLEESGALASANKRVSNLVSKSQLEGDPTGIDSGLFELDAERDLYEAICQKEVELAPTVESMDYNACLVSLSSLRDPVDTFFDEVLVMSEVDSVRLNRIQLLKKLRSLFLQVADVSLLHTS